MSKQLEYAVILVGQTGSGKSSTIGIMTNSELRGEIHEQGITLSGKILSENG